MLGWELPPYNSGGLGVACHEIAKGLSIEGVNIDFVVPYKAEHYIEEYTVHAATQKLPAADYPNGVYDSAQYQIQDSPLRESQRQYTRYIEHFVQNHTVPTDIIHAHDWLTFEAAMRAKQLSGKPLVAHVHATEFDRSGEHSGNPLVHEIELNGLQMADKVMAVSQITKDIIVNNYGIPAEKIEVVHNAIDSHTLLQQTNEPQRHYEYLTQMKREGYKVVVSLGRLTVQKGMYYFLQAAAQAAAVNDKLLFLIAGSGEQRNELIELSASLGIADRVLFTGFVRGAKWRDAYAIGDMFVMSSISEPFGLTALEAAGYGNAIILTKQSGVGELLHNVMRYNYWDIERLANQMSAIAEYDELRKQLSDNARYEFERLSWQSVSAKCLSVYRRYHNPVGAAV